MPIRLTGSNSFCFHCHPGVSCFNECCHDTDITLTPYDLIRIGRAVGMTSGEAGRMFGTKAVHDASGMPILKLKRVDTGDERRPCVFLDPEKGCSIYADRPAACRYYPLGLASVKMKGHDAPEDFYFLVKEPHCKGHEENREQTVAEFRADQGVEIYDERNRSWIHILMKLASWKTLGGPLGKEVGRADEENVLHGRPPISTRFAVSFSARASSSAMRSIPKCMQTLQEDDETLLLLAFDWMRAILFAEQTLPLREEVLHESIAKARAGLGGT